MKKGIAIAPLLVGVVIIAGVLLGQAAREVSDLFGGSGRTQVALAQEQSRQAEAQAEQAKAEAVPVTVREYWAGLTDYRMAEGYIAANDKVLTSYIFLAEHDLRQEDQAAAFWQVMICLIIFGSVLFVALFWGRDLAGLLVRISTQ
jgi:hypothetical protein